MVLNIDDSFRQYNKGLYPKNGLISSHKLFSLIITISKLEIFFSVNKTRPNDYEGWIIFDKFKRPMGSLGDYLKNQERVFLVAEERSM